MIPKKFVKFLEEIIAHGGWEYGDGASMTEDVRRVLGDLAELDAIDAALGEFYIPVRDPVTDEPGGAFYQDHGVHIVVEELARANAELAARDRALHLAAEEMVRLQDEVARLHKSNNRLAELMLEAREYVPLVHRRLYLEINEVLEMAEGAR